MYHSISVRHRSLLQRSQRGRGTVLDLRFRSFWCDLQATPWVAFLRSQNGLTAAMTHDPSPRPAP
jgi:hypothetical protein